MKIFPTQSIKELDAYTIENEGACLAGIDKSDYETLGS